jgi:alpha-1,2-mannosyltransferase
VARGPLILGSVLVLGVFGVYLWFALVTASTTFGCDYLTYDAASRTWLAGGQPYPSAVAEAGSCGIFQYPPPFLVAVAPLTLLPPDAANWAWVALLTACVPVAVLAMPVPPFTRLVVLALAGTSWPVLFAIRIGAIGPLLLLLFALAWRWLDRPRGLAAATVAGGFAKLMPGLLVGWMLLTRRWRAAVLTTAAAGVVGVLWLALDPGLWLGFLGVERLVADKVVSAPLNFAPSSLAYFSGVSVGAAEAVGALHAVLVLAVVALASLRRSPDASLIAVAIASQVVAPVLWDHYAIVVFLAVAWLLARRQWWAAALGVAMNWMLILWFQPWQWLLLMDGAMVAVLVVDWIAACRGAATPVAAGAPA